MTILFVIPLQSELDPFVRTLQESGHQAQPITVGRLQAHVFPSLGIVVARGGHGKTQFGVQTQHLLDHLHDITAVICCGTAGALAEDLHVADLVVATATVEHDYTQRFRPHPLPRFLGDLNLQKEMRQLPLQTLPCRVHWGIVASGDEDVIELERGAALREATEACAVAWEGAGGARASDFNNLPFIELRAISDTADHNAAAHFDLNITTAMHNAAEFAMLWALQRRQER